MCLKCNEQPHFPAKCAQFVSYKNDLVKHGDVVPVEKREDYVSTGKYCPNKKCHTYMEKNHGCNHMQCAVCKEYFCWNCHMLWEEHLSHNAGGYSCKVEQENRHQVEIEFKSSNKKKKNKAKLVEKENRYEESLQHRELRSNAIKKEKKEQVRRLMKTLDYSDDLEECQRFLNQTMLFLAELHFICEFSYVSMRSSQQRERMAVSHVVRSVELVIFQMNREMEQGKGAGAVAALRVLFDRGLNCIKLMNKISCE